MNLLSKKTTVNAFKNERIQKLAQGLSSTLASAVMVAVFACPTFAHAEKNKKPAPSKPAFLASDEDRFMALRNAALHNDARAANDYAAQLSQYEIPSYVEYYQLRARIVSAPADEIKNFLNKYQGTAIADRLRNDWLSVLGQRGDWQNFDAQYPHFVLDDDTQLKCYALVSKAIKQHNVADEARDLITAPRDYGHGCYALMTYLHDRGQWSDADLWQQIRIAAQTGALPQAQRVATLLNVPEKKLTQAFEKPAPLLKKAPEASKMARELYIIALGRVARTDADLAADTLSKFSARFNDTERAYGWAQIALQASYKLDPEAQRYWLRVPYSLNLSRESYQWRARIALREGEWSLLKSAIRAMPEDLKNEATWVYWMGRVLKTEGNNTEAQKLFASIADQIHFYGQLATEERGQKIGIPLAAKPVTYGELDAVAKNPGLQRALKFYSMNLRFEGTREWNWELRKMSERQHLAAAELARQNNLLDRMVNTSDRTKTEFDFNQRYPTPFNDSVYKSTQALGLDMAWVYGLVRQESRFVMGAKSQVGASGLMQVMPATARYVAKKIGLGNMVAEQVNDIDTNITLGTNYLNMVLTDLGGSQALASAAYNAGPGRARAWRASLSRPVEGAIFAETIPFSETRGYVKNVLANATYYAGILEKKPQSLKARLGTVVPKGMSEGDPELP
jgi:soluble lytic murein transglycosylase